MANMSVNQRIQADRIDLSVPSTGVGVRRRWRLVAYVVCAVAVAAALGYAAAERLDDWAQGVVLGMIVLTTVGLMIAISPRRG